MGLNPGIVALLIPILALMIPIVALLTRHQQQMAEIMARRSNTAGEVDMLRREVGELKALIHQQTIALDNLALRPRQVDVNDDLRTRVG